MRVWTPSRCDVAATGPTVAAGRGRNLRRSGGSPHRMARALGMQTTNLEGSFSAPEDLRMAYSILERQLRSSGKSS